MGVCALFLCFLFLVSSSFSMFMQFHKDQTCGTIARPSRVEPQWSQGSGRAKSMWDNVRAVNELRKLGLHL